MNINHIKKAFAPASIGNVAVGFDMLGAALENIGDIVIAKRIKTKGIFIEEIVDIEGNLKPKPFYDTKAKMLWDDNYFYFGVEMEEPHIRVVLQHDLDMPQVALRLSQSLPLRI